MGPRIRIAILGAAFVAFHAALALLIPLQAGASGTHPTPRVPGDAMLELVSGVSNICATVGVGFPSGSLYESQFAQWVVSTNGDTIVSNPVSRFRQTDQALVLWQYLNQAVVRCSPTNVPDAFGLPVPADSAEWVRIPPERLDEAIAVGTRTVQSCAILADIAPGAMTAYWRGTPTGAVNRVDWLPASTEGTWALATLSSLTGTNGNRRNVVCTHGEWGNEMVLVAGTPRVRAAGGSGVGRPTIALSYGQAGSFATNAACRVSDGGSGDVALLRGSGWAAVSTTETVRADGNLAGHPLFVESFSPALPTGQTYQVEYVNARVYVRMDGSSPEGAAPRPFTWADFECLSNAIESFPLHVVKASVDFEATNAVAGFDDGYVEGQWSTNGVFSFSGVSLTDTGRTDEGWAGDADPAEYPWARGSVVVYDPLVVTNGEDWTTNYNAMTMKHQYVNVHAPDAITVRIDGEDWARVTNIWPTAEMTLRGRWGVYSSCDEGGVHIPTRWPPLHGSRCGRGRSR